MAIPTGTADRQSVPSNPTPCRTERPEARALPLIRLHGVPLHAISEMDTVRYVFEELEAGRGGWIVTHNLDHLRRRLKIQTFADLCEDASVAVADGMPLVWASRLQGTPLPERVAGSNLISSLSAAAAETGRSVFLLGGAEGTADAAAEVLEARHPGLRIAGTHCPPRAFEGDPQQMSLLTERILVAAPDIVFVALGSPKQERFIRILRPKLPNTWWIGVGISFSFLCGDVKRAPAWMQRIGLEWVHRLMQEPRRLARRYLIDDIPFAIRLLTSCAWQGARNGG